MKICNELAPIDSFRLPTTLMEVVELVSAHEDEETSDSSRTLYQRKVGSPLFVATVKRPEIAFAVSRLPQFNQQPGKRHHEAADRVSLPISDAGVLHPLRGDAQDLSSFICASDASLFGDNTLDRKSSQGYIMKLFGGAVPWRANKQDTVTTYFFHRGRASCDITDGKRVDLPFSFNESAHIGHSGSFHNRM